MSATRNEVFLRGRAGKNAETRYTQSGKAVTTFSLATGGGEKNGKKIDPDWHQIKAWNSENAQSIEKGQRIEVRGFLSYEKWTDKQTGQQREKAVVVAQSVELAEDEGRTESARPTQNLTIEDSDLPF